jgi:hypothetical protein
MSKAEKTKAKTSKRTKGNTGTRANQVYADNKKQRLEFAEIVVVDAARAPEYRMQQHQMILTTIDSAGQSAGGYRKRK